MMDCVKQHLIFKTYGAKKDGTIVNLKTKKTLNTYKINSGYMIIGLQLNKKSETTLVHRFVYECFNGKIPNGLHIDHIDGDKTNNRINNLEAVSRSENMKRMHKNRKLKEQRTKILATCQKTGETKMYKNMLTASKQLTINLKLIKSVLNKHKQLAAKSEYTGNWFTFHEPESL